MENHCLLVKRILIPSRKYSNKPTRKSKKIRKKITPKKHINVDFAGRFVTSPNLKPIIEKFVL
jgi:hypothetical protein